MGSISLGNPETVPISPTGGHVFSAHCQVRPQPLNSSLIVLLPPLQSTFPQLGMSVSCLKLSRFPLRSRGPDSECGPAPWFLSLFFFLGPHLQHIQVPWLGVESELQLPAYPTAMATLNPRRICNLCCHLWQCQMLNPQSKARDWTCILMDTGQVRNLLSHSRNS